MYLNTLFFRHFFDSIVAVKFLTGLPIRTLETQMRLGRSIMTLSILMMLISFSAQAQVNGSSGGGGPSREDIKAICSEWVDKVQPLEKSFVEKKGGTYKSQKDFFKQLEIIIALEVGKSILKINAPNNGCANKPNAAEITLLKEIKEIWESGFVTEKKCLGMFTQRYHHRGLLDSVINLYCSKSGDQPQKPHEGK